jgi:hypothetical protein
MHLTLNPGLAVGDSIKFWSGACLVLGIIIFLGWREPLRYRLMSRAEIEAEERAIMAGPDPTPHWMWAPGRRTKLDERPVRTRPVAREIPR